MKKNFHDKTMAELKVELVESCKALFSARMRAAARQFENTSEFRKMRRDVARIKTIMAQKERVPHG